MKKRSIVLFLCMLLAIVQVVPAFAGVALEEETAAGGSGDLGDFRIAYYDLSDGCFHGRFFDDEYKMMGISDNRAEMSINVSYYDDSDGDNHVLVNLGSTEVLFDEMNYSFTVKASDFTGGDMTLKEFMGGIEKENPDWFVSSFFASINGGDYSSDFGELIYMDAGYKHVWYTSSQGTSELTMGNEAFGEYLYSGVDAAMLSGRNFGGIDGIEVANCDGGAVIKFFDIADGSCISEVPIKAKKVDLGDGYTENRFYFTKADSGMKKVLEDYSGKMVIYATQSPAGFSHLFAKVIYEHKEGAVAYETKLNKAVIGWADGAPDFTYDGMPHTPDIKVTVHGTEVSSSEYDVKYFVKGIEVQPDEIINAGKVTIKIVPSEGSLSTGSRTKTYRIKPRNIAAADKGLAPEFISLVNGGEDVPCDISGTKPEFSISYNGINELIKGIDYTVKYSGNKKVGEGSLTGKKNPRIIVKGKGNYTGKAIIPFNIVQQDINNLDVRYNDVVNIPTGKDAAKLMNKPVVWSGNKKLKAGRDYTVTYYVSGNALDISKDHNYPDGTEVSMVIEAKKDADGNYVGNFKGSTEIEGTKESEITYFISNKLIKSSMVSIEPGAVYGAGDDEEFISKIKVYEKVGGKKTVIDREYYNIIVIPESVELIARGKNKGKVKVSVFVLGNGTEYGGKIIKTFIVGLGVE